MAPNRPIRKRGMTLIEVIVALVLLTIGLFGVLDMYMGVARGLAASRKEMQADNLLRAHLTNLETAGFAALDDWIRVQAAPPSPDVAARFPSFQKSLLPGFTWNAELKREQNENPKRIMVTVALQWSANGKTKERKAIGYVFAP